MRFEIGNISVKSFLNPAKSNYFQALKNVATVEKISYKPLFSLPVIVAALGYFVDIYDLLLFGIVREPSLLGLGFTAAEVDSVGGTIINW